MNRTLTEAELIVILGAENKKVRKPKPRPKPRRDVDTQAMSRDEMLYRIGRIDGALSVMAAR